LVFKPDAVDRVAALISLYIASSVIAVGVDLLLGEPKRLHPLIGFGHLAHKFEQKLNNPNSNFNQSYGVLAAAALVIPFAGVFWIVNYLSSSLWLTLFVNTAGIYFALGLNSLNAHIWPIIGALSSGDRDRARELTSYIVSRDKDQLDIEVSAAESALENGGDAVFSALFWGAVFGAPGAVAYRLVNTLDAMWGYKTPRFLSFGWAAARLDDLLNYVPARLTALSYALVSGQPKKALKAWITQAKHHASPNAGPVICSGAGGLNVKLGGPTCYNGVWKNKPWMGGEHPCDVKGVQSAIQLVNNAALLWVCALILIWVGLR
jgi:adenosylcobinamide-phosphate synthase